MGYEYFRNDTFDHNAGIWVHSLILTSHNNTQSQNSHWIIIARTLTSQKNLEITYLIINHNHNKNTIHNHSPKMKHISKIQQHWDDIPQVIPSVGWSEAPATAMAPNPVRLELAWQVVRIWCSCWNGQVTSIATVIIWTCYCLNW